MNAIRRHPIVSALILAGVIFVCCVGSFVAYVVVSTLGAVGGLPDAPLLATVRPTVAPTAAPTDDPAGGLGATRAALDHRLSDTLIAYFSEGAQRAWYVERQSSSGLDLEAEIEALTPEDRILVDTYPTSDGARTARVYTSVWLAEQFDDDQWGGAEPGTFVVTFNASDPVTRIVIATGNTP